jgi:Domain of unknown function (DUF4351)
VATDSNGNSATSSPIAVQVALPVSVQLTTPAGGPSLYIGDAIGISATAKVYPGAIAQVEFDRFPHQVVLYVGEAPLSMETELNGPALKYSYRLVDVRDLNGERLLESPRVMDNIIAILTRLPDARAAIRRVMKKIAGLEPAEREAALARLAILAGLRRLGEVIGEEARKMPILNDILDHDLLGPEYRRGELSFFRRQMEERFGPIPRWAEERIAGLSTSQIEDLGVRLLKAGTIEELFR